MEATFEKIGFGKRLKSMLKVDFKRMFTMPLVYILAGVCLALPILMLVMTTMTGGAEEGAEAMGTFTNAWQSIGSLSGAGMTMDLTGMCNINLLYFLIPVLVCVFVGEDFKSGYAKNLFTVRSKKSDYVISKSLVGFVGGTLMLSAYFIGTLIGGAIAGLPFSTEGFGAGGVVACMFSKWFLIAIYVGISLLLSTVAKQRLWISILGSFAAGALLFTMLPMTSPLDSGVLNVILCFAGGAMFIAGLGALSGLVLKKTSLV